MAQKSGSLYKQKNSKFWWIKYYTPNSPKPIRESTKTEDEGEANNVLWRRLGEVATGRFNGLEPERIKANELFDMFEEDYENKGRSSLKQARLRIKAHLRPFFGPLKAATVGTRQISAYITKRKRGGAKNATINRELEILRRAFNLGFKAQPQLVLKPITFEKLPEDNIREGLLPHAQYLKLREGLPEPYKTFLVCGYHLGTRAGELLQIRWENVDFERKEIVIKRYTTKIKEPRILPIYGDMMAFLLTVKASRDLLYPDCPWVFQRRGKRFIFTHKTWNSMVKELGAPGLHFHDLRRTAVTNMIEAGFSEKEAMTISGHRTDRMLRRYHIVRRHRIQALGSRMEEYYKELGAGAGHSSGHSVPKEEKGLIN